MCKYTKLKKVDEDVVFGKHRSENTELQTVWWLRRRCLGSHAGQQVKDRL